MDEVPVDDPAELTEASDRTVALGLAFLVRVAMVAAWLVAFAALVAPVRPGSVECGPAAGYLLGIEAATFPTTVSEDDARSDCVRETGFHVAAGVVLAGAAFLAGRPLLRRVDPPAGL